MNGEDIVISEKNPPKILWHYTSLETLTRILKSKHLRMSNIFYMNDSMEHLLLRKLAAKMTSQKIQHEEVRRELIKVFNQKEPPQVYATCFSAEGDLLTQWRAYGDDGSGVAIGLRSGCLKIKPGTYLYKVFYEQEEHKEICEYFLKWDFDDHGSKLKKQFDEMMRNNIPVNLFTQAARCKSEGFKSEQEYRIVHKVYFDTSKDTLILDSSSYGERLCFYVDAKKRLVPFVPYPIDIQKGIAEIKLGPKNKDDKTKDSLNMLLDTLGISKKQCKVSKSKLTYR